MIKGTGIVRKVDELGRFVLPAEIRKNFGILEAGSLEIMVDEEKGQIVLQKVKKSCLRCQSEVQLRELKAGFYVCEACLQDLR